MINKIYTSDQVLKQIKHNLERENNIRLINFLYSEHITKLEAVSKKISLATEYIPEKFSYSASKFEDPGFIKEITTFLSHLLNIKPKLISSRIFKFKHRDYTLLEDDRYEKEGLTLIIDLTKSWYQAADGYHSFLKENNEIARINPAFNTLTIIKTTTRMKSFIKYINHLSKNKERLFIELKYYYS